MTPSATAAVKRLIGKDFEDVEEVVEQLAYDVGADEDGFLVLDCPNLAASSSDSGGAAAAAGDEGDGDAGVNCAEGTCMLRSRQFFDICPGTYALYLTLPP